MVAEVPFHERWWCSISEAQQLTGLGRTKLFEAVAEKKIVSKKEGSRRLISVPSLMETYGCGAK
jgi:hypothetical protein